MITSFLNIINLIVLVFSVSKKLKRQRYFVDKHLLPLINASKLKNDGTLDDEDFRKIITYANTIPAMLGEAFCAFRGEKMSESERRCISFLASITGLFDDLFDRKNLSPNYIKKLLDRPYQINAVNSNELLLIELYQSGLKLSDKADKIKEYAYKVYEAQLQSKKQQNSKLQQHEIQQITFEKGGVSIPLYRCAFYGAISNAEYTLLYKLGAIGQLENDIFDVYNDFSEGISTLATTATNISMLQKTYVELIDEIMQLIQDSEYPEKYKFKLMVSLVVSRGLIALDKLKKTAKTTGGVFQPEKYTRNELVCDMERPDKLFKLILYAAKYAKK